MKQAAVSSLEQRTPAWINHLPYWSIWKDAIATVDGYLIVGAKLQGVDVHCRTNTDIGAINRHLRRWLDGLEEHLHLQIVSEYRNYSDESPVFSKFLEAFHGDARGPRCLAKNKVEYLRSQNRHVDIGTYLFLSLPLRRKRKSILNRIVSSPRGDLGVAHDQTYKKLRQSLKTARETLSGVEIIIEPLESKKLTDIIYRVLNPQRSKVHSAPNVATEKRKKSALLSQPMLRETLSFSSMKVERDALCIDGQWIRILSLKTLPDATTPAGILPLLHMPALSGRDDGAVEYSLSYGLAVLPQIQELGRLKLHGNMRQVLASFSNKPSNIESQIANADHQTCLQHIVENDQRIYSLSLQLAIKATSKRILDQCTDQALSWFRQVNQMEGMAEQFSQFPAFVGCLPGNTHQSIRNVRVTSENAADLIPIYQSWKGTKRPVTLMTNHLNGVVSFDPFDENLQAYNAILCGSTGSGKSFTASYLLQSFLPRCKTTLIIDLGGSYRKLCAIFGGLYIDVAKGVKLNPFFHPNEIFSEDGAASETKLQFLTSLLERMLIERERKELSLYKIEKALLRRAIESTYQQWPGKRPILEDVVSTLNEMSRSLRDQDEQRTASRLAKRLKLWCQGSYGRLFNTEDGISLDRPFVVLDLKGIDGDLKEVVLLTLIGHAWSKIMGEEGQKMVVLDEVWNLLEDPVTSSFVAELYRTARKYHCGILSISQSPEDFSNSLVGPAVLSNSIVRYILRLKDGWVCLTEKFKLNEREVALIQQLRMEKGLFSELFMAFGDRKTIMRVQPSPLEYWICSSHPRDLGVQRRFRDRYPKLSELDLMRLLAKLYPKGAWQSEV